MAGNLIKESVVYDVRNAKVWSFLADETMDRNKREQLVLVVRFVSFGDGGMLSVNELPLCVHCCATESYIR